MGWLPVQLGHTGAYMCVCTYVCMFGVYMCGACGMYVCVVCVCGICVCVFVCNVLCVHMLHVVCVVCVWCVHGVYLWYCVCVCGECMCVCGECMCGMVCVRVEIPVCPSALAQSCSGRSFRGRSFTQE